MASLGGGLGAVARYHLGRLIKARLDQTWLPNAMLIVNIIGSFGLGVTLGGLFGSVTETDPLPNLYFFLATGFMAAFTTFSTFSTEAVGLIRTRKFYPACLYISVTLVASFLVFLAGMWLTV
ncbi:CrcB protein [[Bacillus] selenitireducens MLS10]|uniref:Fluoride-specific ion channel FluC n=2 Tax=Salisediminibacterium selenitireducens TaxID=85683 RepID=D6XXI6_BACIE|nr:CrcB protein [[Bacillus] selenitireducens MLS10]